LPLFHQILTIALVSKNCYYSIAAVISILFKFNKIGFGLRVNLFLLRVPDYLVSYWMTILTVYTYKT